MSEDNKPTRPVKEKVKEELTSTDDNKDSFDRGDARGSGTTENPKTG